ncbi:glycosyltransferase [Paenibacillus aceti]|uniref:Glycosyl transferase family 1 n=1 Tax=Paenibacillus aceti TaxID=1820010 RepID=A0ABQ1VUW0_9BACL|nr:glycosyltransferase [Paenibacillus aceti]GGG00526.1 glycosyl transferase family 1 [Paenibacillus aceti]
MLKILFILTGLNYAGAENQVVQLCRGFRSRGHQALVVSMVEPEAYLEELGELGVEVRSLGMAKGVPDPRGILRLRQIIKEFGPDVVHSHLVHANILARITRLFVKMPVLICTAHNVNEGGKLREWLYRMTDPLCELTTNVSEEAVRQYVERKVVPRHKIKFMPNGITLGSFGQGRDKEWLADELGIAADSFVWLAVGRLVPEKDYPNLFAAFTAVLKQYPGSVLLVAGTGPERPALEKQCRELGIEDQVKLLGLRKDIPALMRFADAYVMSSQWEGFPMVLLEASASGLPMVVTDVGGNREAVLDGVSGLLVPPEDSQQLSDRMLEMMSLSTVELAAMGEQARKHVSERFDMEVIVTQWTRIYELKGISPGV